MWLEALKTLAVLLGILGLIFFLAYAVKRFGIAGAGRDSSQEGWRILGAKSLGPKRQVYLLEAGSKIFLIGVTDKTMSSLGEISDAKDHELLVELSQKKEKSFPTFQEVLRRTQK